MSDTTGIDKRAFRGLLVAEKVLSAVPPRGQGMTLVCVLNQLAARVQRLGPRQIAELQLVIRSHVVQRDAEAVVLCARGAEGERSCAATPEVRTHSV